jgi:methyltransferase
MSGLTSLSVDLGLGLDLHPTQVLYLLFLAALGIQRLIELRISGRNQRWALEQGGVEYGREHFPLMKVLHTGFLLGCAIEVVFLDRPFSARLGFAMLALVAVAQGLRFWAMATLGRRWNVRVIVIPGQSPVTGGPYRFVRHPNYLAVIIEFLAIPLIHSALWTAIAFSVLNAWMLSVRIRCEERALNEHADYQQRLGKKNRFVPMGSSSS